MTAHKDNSRILRPKSLTVEELLRAVNTKLRTLNETDAVSKSKLELISTILERNIVAEDYDIILPGNTGTVGVGAKSYSVANIGEEEALLGGKVLPAGISVSFNPELNEVCTGKTYDSQLSTLVITTII